MAVSEGPYTPLRGQVDWNAMVALAKERRAQSPGDQEDWWVRTDVSMSPSIVTQIHRGMVRAIPDPDLFEFTTRKDYDNDKEMQRASWIYMRCRP